MYTEKIEKLENEIQEIKKYIKADKKEIKKSKKILSLVVDNTIEVEIEMNKEEIEKYTNKLKNPYVYYLTSFVYYFTSFVC